jgi:hypothetical protein
VIDSLTRYDVVTFLSNHELKNNVL